MKKLKKREILCTLGPASLNRHVMKRLESIGVSLFRINMSHTDISELPKIITKIQSSANVPICIDTEGAQIRTGKLLSKEIILKENDIIQIPGKKIDGNSTAFNLYPYDIVEKLNVSDILTLDFNSVLIQVIDKNKHGLKARIINGGVLGQNKAVSVNREIALPPLTKKDELALDIAMKAGITNVALSFANSRSDVAYVRSKVKKGVFLISKIESCSGINSLKEITKSSDAVLLDRGDLSRQVPIEQIPKIQKEVISTVKKLKTKIYVATNLMESMVTALNPTRAEVNDVFNTLNDGADGLVLAAETAIGEHPVQCARMVSKIIDEFHEYDQRVHLSVEEIKEKNSQLYIDSHGGKLVDRLLTDIDLKRIKKYKRLKVDHKTLIDAEQIAIGAFSPLEGFMLKDELDSVIRAFKLPNGVVFPLPVLLQVKKEQAKGFKKGMKVLLCSNQDNKAYAILSLEEKYQYDLSVIAKEVFGTENEDHPGVFHLKANGDYFLGGKIELIQRLPSKNKYYELTPRQVRDIFEHKGWSRVVGFHSRNVAHRVHEHIQLLAFKKFHCDGMFIHPLIGPKKEGDYNSNIILESYRILVEKYYPKEKVVLSGFQNYPRYAGPREAVFTAICRKNFGCSHFIVGRDHSGVGNYYPKNAAHKLFDQLGDIGITPIFFNEFHFCNKCKSYVDKCSHDPKDIFSISGSEGREMIDSKKVPPQWFMRKEVAEYIIEEMDKGSEVFS